MFVAQTVVILLLLLLLDDEGMSVCSKKSPTGPTEWTPKPEYLIALAPYLRVPLVRYHVIFDRYDGF